MKTAKWVGDCFIYTTSTNRLSYFVGSESYTISPFDTYVPFFMSLPPSFLTLTTSPLSTHSPLYLLGYIPTHNRVYLADKDLHIYGYALSLTVVEYQTAVLRGDMEAASEILPTLPRDQLNRVARFLEGRGEFSAFLLFVPFGPFFSSFFSFFVLLCCFSLLPLRL